LFGYDWVVIGGAKRFYEIFFGIRDMPVMQGWMMSSAIVGCLIGAISAGSVSDKYGRKKPLIFSAALFTIAAIGTGAANSITGFIFFRIVGGVGIGMASVLSPVYIAEISPSRFRGRFVSINQLTIVIGILMAQLINMLIAKDVPAGFSDAEILASWNAQMGWRWMFWVQTIFASTFFIMAFLIPESLRFLMLLSVLIGISIYAMTLAPTTWVVLSEIFPNKVRGIAMSIATLALWSGCFVITYLFPVLNKWAGASGSFWTFGVICIIGFLFIKKYLPETKGKSLEEIEQSF
jgi:MFS family permease